MPESRRPARGWKRYGGNVAWLAAASFLNDVASEMIYPLLPLFIVGTLGGGAAVLGTIEGVAESTSSLLKLAGGWFSDRTGRRKPLVAWGYGVAAAVRPLVALTATPWQVLWIRFADRVGKGVRTAPRDALLAESVPTAERGRAFGLNRAADHAGAVVGPLLAAGLLLVWPGQLRWVFALAAVPGVLALVVVVARVREARRVTVTVPEPPSPGRALPRSLARYLAVLLLFTLGNASDAFLLLRAQQLGVGVALIPVLWALLHVSKSLSSVPGGALADRLGARRTIVAGWLVYAGVYAGFAAAQSPWHAWLLFAVYGLFFGLTEAPEKALVAALAPEHARGRAYGAFHLAIGIAALPASVIFGVLWEAAGASVAFLVGAGLALAAALLLPVSLRSSDVRAAHVESTGRSSA